MDILKIIKDKIKNPKLKDNSIILDSILTHIERAEMFLNRGQEANDDQYFTDAIYRTNHAFEGILKEAYKILTNKTPDRMNIADIEKYFIDNNIFNNRVMELFKNYRQSWRNPSTHEYNLFQRKDHPQSTA